MTASAAAATLRDLLRPIALERDGVEAADRRALAGILVELARHVRPEISAQAADVPRVDPRLEELRRVVLGGEIAELARLSGIIDDPEKLAAAIGEVLPSAVAHATQDERLGHVLAPAFEKATQSSIRNDPRTLVNILYPLIVPAIRKSIGEAIDDTFQSLNESLKASLTWRGLRWRWEAWRTGVPFAEVVLKHQLVYQVEHVFLIHHHTGLLISHVAAEDAASQDPQLVSSMLVAIQDFVRDSFQGSAPEGLDALRLGELRLWAERGPHATLVAVIRGNPPEELHAQLRTALSRIHVERRQALEAFDGDSSGLADIEAQLAECAALRQQAPRAARRGFPWLVAGLAAALLLLITATSGWWWHTEQLRLAELQAALEAERRLVATIQREADTQWANEVAAIGRLWTDAVGRLSAEPGVVVTDAAWDSRWDEAPFRVAGLRDPLAAEPRAILAAAGIDPALVTARFAPYQALEPAFVLERLRSSLQPPAGVSLQMAGDRIVAQGEASATWLSRARVAARLLPAGVPPLDLKLVRNADEGAIADLREKIEAQEIRFDSNEPLPARGQEAVLDRLVKDLNDLAILSATRGVTARVTLTGHSDDTGRGTFNLSLSLSRAGAVVALLKKRGVNPDLLMVTRGAGPLEPVEEGMSPAARSANRRVSFSIGIEERP